MTTATRPVEKFGLVRESDPRRLGDLARPNAPGADLYVFRSAIDHCPDALDIGQPTPLAHIVGMGDLASGYRALAADFTSLRHRRNPPRNPHRGVELNSTGGAVLQAMGVLMPQITFHRGGLCGAEKLH